MPLTSADREVRYLLEVEDVLFLNLIGELVLAAAKATLCNFLHMHDKDLA